MDDRKNKNYIAFFAALIYPKEKTVVFIGKDTVDLPGDYETTEKIKYLQTEGLCKACYRQAWRKIEATTAWIWSIKNFAYMKGGDIGALRKRT